MPRDYETRIFLAPQAFSPHRAREFFAQVLGAVPEDWSDASGLLEPTAALAAERRIARGAGYRFNRFGSLGEIAARPFDEGGDARTATEHPDVAALIVDGMLPAFVHFRDVGFGSDWKLPRALRVAQGFIRAGYQGHLSVNNGRNRRYSHEMPAILRLQLSDWSDWTGGPGPGDPRRRMPPAVVLEWSARLRGSVEQFGDIPGVCERFAESRP